MDPFDDYDPQQYVYDESDEDGEIVYLEGPAIPEKTHNPPYLPANDATDLLPASQSQTNTETPADLPVNLLPRRERKRRRRLATRKPDEEDDDSSVSYATSEASNDEQKDEKPLEEEPGAFESLQSLLLSRKEAPTESTDAQPGSNQRIDTRQDESVPAGPSVQYPVSQTQFPAVDDDDMGATQQSRMPTESTQTLPQDFPRAFPRWEQQPAVNGALQRELKRQRNHQQGLLNRQSAPAALTQNSRLLAELHKNRQHVKESVSHRRQKPASARGRSLQRQPQSQLPRTSIPAPAANIVGSRPQHWSTARSLSQPAPKTKRKSGRTARPQLSAQSMPSRTPSVRPRMSIFGSAAPSSLRNTFLREKQAGPRQNTSDPQEESATGAAPITSFAPSFLSSSSKKSQPSVDAEPTDEVQENTQPSRFDAVQRTPLHRSLFSASSRQAVATGTSSNGSAPNSNRKSRSKKLKAGPLMQRLRSIRGSIQGDKTRFQSGMYPFNKSGSLDRNDPRRRASHYMDVTIVGDPIPWEAQHEHVTALGYVHSLVATLEQTETNLRKEDDSFFAWVCFSFDTAREQSLRRGSQLRIYNAVYLSLPTGDKQFVVCTQLCEAYPSSLPQLTLPTEFSNETAPNNTSN